MGLMGTQTQHIDISFNAEALNYIYAQHGWVVEIKT